MLKWFRKWHGNRKLKRIDDAYTHGYDYAAGALLRGEKTPYDLEAEADTSSTFHEDEENRSWDRGMMAAVDKLVLYGVVDDNRFGANWPEYADEEAHEKGATANCLRSPVRLRLVQTGVKEESDVQS